MGGPLFNKGETSTLMGIASHGNTCDESKLLFPSVCSSREVNTDILAIRRMIEPRSDRPHFRAKDTVYAGGRLVCDEYVPQTCVIKRYS